MAQFAHCRRAVALRGRILLATYAGVAALIAGGARIAAGF